MSEPTTLKITRGDNGYRLNWVDYDEEGRKIQCEEYVQDDEQDELRAIESLLWWIINHYGFYGSKHDPERIRIVRELPSGEYKED